MTMPRKDGRDGRTDLKSAYHRHIETTPVGERIADAEIFRIWNETVGATIAGQFQPCQFQNGALVLLFENHSWAQEIQWRKAALIEALNARLDKPRIKELRFRAGKPLSPKPVTRSEALPLPLPTRVPPPEEAILRIADRELREAFLQMAEAIRQQANS